MKSTIKSIVVKRRAMNLSVGSVLHTCEAFGSKSVVVIGDLEAAPFSTKLKVHCIAADHNFYVGRDDYIFLGDLGVPGHTYDDRPCSLFTSKKAADAHGKTYWNWLSTSRYNEPDDSYRWH